ncbi:MAG: cytochrome c oxidase subunit II [Acidobacteria bacterium]|nr:cytochrome c oxidase subunit II [Acidobacteriota bacterium]
MSEKRADVISLRQWIGLTAFLILWLAWTYFYVQGVWWLRGTGVAVGYALFTVGLVGLLLRSPFRSIATPVTLAFLLFLLTVSTIYVFVQRTWWFPEPISTFGEAIDKQFDRTLVICGIVFFLAQLGLGYVVLRYRDRGGRAHYSHGSTTLEILWTTATALMFVGLGVAAERSWAAMHFLGAAPGAMQVEITGQQFQWNFRYPGPDGVFGRTDPALVNDSGGNFLGLDPTDPAAADDLVLPIMAVPVNREVEVILKAKDVTHSFFVRELRFKQDTVPGLTIRLHFRAEKTGTFEIACAELCGLGHHRMRSTMQVLSPEEFENWLKEQAAY